MNSKGAIWWILLGIVAGAVIIYLVWLRPTGLVIVKEIEVKDADTVYSKTLARTEIPTKPEGLVQLFISHTDTKKSGDLSGAALSTPLEAIEQLFLSHTDTDRTNELVSVVIPTVSAALEELFISHADAMSTMELKKISLIEWVCFSYIDVLTMLSVALKERDPAPFSLEVE